MSQISEPPPLPDAKKSVSTHFLFSPRLLVLLGSIVVVAGFVWTLHAGPKPLPWYPRCPLFVLTGLHCPGCGSARTVHALAHGAFAEAAGRNILLVGTMPFLGMWALAAFYRGLVRNLPPPTPPIRVARTAFVLVMLFGVLRNLPWWPFTLLAP